MSECTLTQAPGQDPDTTVVHLSGPFVLGVLPEAVASLRAIDARKIVIDLKDVPHMDSAGLGAMLNLASGVQSAGRSIAFAAPSKRVQMLFDLTKVGTVLRIFPTVEDAENA